MSANYSPPSRNPADNDTLGGLIKLALNKFLQKTDDMLPAQVIAYDVDKNVAQIQPLISIITTGGDIVQRAQIASVPVYQISAGGFIIRFPVKSGDLGWIKANDRDISLFKQSGKMSQPNTQRKHSFEDAMFYPQTAWSNVTVADPDLFTIQNYAGTVKISLSESQIVIDAPSEVIANTPLMRINGALHVTGDIIAGSGSSNISVLSHVHGGVTSGGSDTGTPV